MKTSEILNKAADLIEEDGWGRGKWTNAEGQHCLAGGIACALGLAERGVETPGLGFYAHDDRAALTAYSAVETHLGEKPWIWNDVEAESKEQVIEVLRATAVIESAREEAAETVNQPTEELAVTW